MDTQQDYLPVHNFQRGSKLSFRLALQDTRGGVMAPSAGLQTDLHHSNSSNVGHRCDMALTLLRRPALKVVE